MSDILNDDLGGFWDSKDEMDAVYSRLEWMAQSLDAMEYLLRANRIDTARKLIALVKDEALALSAEMIERKSQHPELLKQFAELMDGIIKKAPQIH